MNNNERLIPDDDALKLVAKAALNVPDADDNDIELHVLKLCQDGRTERIPIAEFRAMSKEQQLEIGNTNAEIIERAFEKLKERYFRRHERN